MNNMTIHLRIWRQKNAGSPGKLVPYTVNEVSPEMSILEVLDVLNEELVKKGEEPIEFDNDCREGICGMCSLVINGIAHGPQRATASCELRMRHFKDGDTITLEPFRARAFPLIKDLVVDRSAFDRIITAGGYISVNVGSAPDANLIPIPKDKAEEAMDAAACIGCGACVAACPNASASLFTAAKISQFALLPQGHPERKRRVMRMVEQMDKEGFGDCSNHAECEAVCPKEISISHIARMKREYFKVMVS
jgi:succinate dehydrogenase / fumarate reductase iron-sulfur subunit